MKLEYIEEHWRMIRGEDDKPIIEFGNVWTVGMGLKTSYYPDKEKLKITIKKGEYFTIVRNNTIKQSIKVSIKEGDNNFEICMVNGVIKVLGKKHKKIKHITMPLYNISVYKSSTGAICVNKIIDNRGKEC